MPTNTVRNYVVAGKIEDAIKVLEDNLKDADDQQAITMLSAQYKELKRNKLMGLYSHDEETRERNKIIMRLLEMANRIPASGGTTRDALGIPRDQTGDSGKGAMPRNTSGVFSGSLIHKEQESANAQNKNIKILFLGVSPSDTARIRFDKEARDIDEGLRRSKFRDRFTFVPKLAVRVEDLRRHLLDESPAILHFSGHGAGEKGLLFQNNTGQYTAIQTGPLAGLFKLFSDNLQCVLLNACHSEVQARAIVQHIPYVIGMSDAIPDETAIEFATAFYDTLGAGREIEFAFELGCNAISISDLQGELLPQLYKKEN